MYFFVPSLKEKWVEKEAASVMFAHRLERGEEITVTDLQGGVARAKVAGYDKATRRFRLDIRESTQVPKPKQLLVFQANLDKLYMEKLVEVLGYTDITTLYLLPLERSQAQKIDPIRLLKILQRAVLLGERAWMPSIQPIANESEVRSLINQEKPTVLQASNGVEQAVKTFDIRALLIGPEGGFSPTELTWFADLKLPTMSLGSHIYPGWLAGFVALSKLSEH